GGHAPGIKLYSVLNVLLGTSSYRKPAQVLGIVALLFLRGVRVEVLLKDAPLAVVLCHGLLRKLAARVVCRTGLRGGRVFRWAYLRGDRRFGRLVVVRVSGRQQRRVGEGEILAAPLDVSQQDFRRQLLGHLLEEQPPLGRHIVQGGLDLGAAQ